MIIRLILNFSPIPVVFSSKDARCSTKFTNLVTEYRFLGAKVNGTRTFERKSSREKIASLKSPLPSTRMRIDAKWDVLSPELCSDVAAPLAISLSDERRPNRGIWNLQPNLWIIVIDV